MTVGTCFCAVVLIGEWKRELWN